MLETIDSTQLSLYMLIALLYVNASAEPSPHGLKDPFHVLSLAYSKYTTGYLYSGAIVK